MNDLAVAAAGGAGVGAALATTLWLVHRPLAATMGELCGERQRGQFWTSMSEIALVAGSLLVAALGALASPVFTGRTSALAAVLSLLRWGLGGLLAALAAVGVAVLRFTARLGTHPPPPHGAGSLPVAGADRSG